MNDLERLAVAQAAYKALGAMVSASDPESLRGRVDGLLREDYEEKGTDRFRLKVNGQEVGTLSARFTKETHRLVVEDMGAFADWLVGDGRMYLELFLRSPRGRGLVDACAAAIFADGEVPAGCAVYTEPPRFDGTVIKGCEPEKVAPALGMTLPQAVAGLLAGGE